MHRPTVDCNNDTLYLCQPSPFRSHRLSPRSTVAFFSQTHGAKGSISLGMVSYSFMVLKNSDQLQ